MIWNFITKIWPARINRKTKIGTIKHSRTIHKKSTSANNNNINNIIINNRVNSRNIRILVRRHVGTVVKATVNRKLSMDRQRSAKRSSFRMRINRRIRAGFMPVPQQDSDTENVASSTRADLEEDDRKTEQPGSFKSEGGNKNVEEKKENHKGILKCRDIKDNLGISSETRPQGGSLKERPGQGGKYDLTVDSKVELGFSFRRKRRSFGSESEKRRGERFLRREIEKKRTVEESDDGDDSSDSSECHVCDLNCPLILHGECPNIRHKTGQAKAHRRSSLNSPTSRDTTLTSVTSPARRPLALASVSIDDILGHDLDPRVAVRSPGVLSMASMWSTSDLHHEPGAVAAVEAAKHEPDTVSNTGATSLSNVSETFSERMHDLVRAFSNRTQKTKDKISQPPTPSTDSDNDAKSVVSGAEEEKQAPRNIRLGSFLPLSSQASDALSDENHDHFLGVWHCRVKTPKWLKKLRFPTTVEPHSKMYVSWLFLVSIAFLYNAVVIPLRGVFPYQTSENVHLWLAIDYLCDIIYLLDIVMVKCRLRFTNDGVVECSRRETRKNYMKKSMFKFDIISLIPLDLFYFIKSVGVNPWLRLPRMLKIQTYWEFYEKCDQVSRSSAHAIRIVKTVTYMLFLIHIETCGYYAVSLYEGLGTNKWVYSGQGIAYIRCFYLATKTATSIGNNPIPTNQLEYSFMTLYWLSGVFVFALLIGQIRDIVEAACMVKDNYRKKMDACLWYMQSINLPREMKDRVRMWFLYNWDQQKTIDERSLVRSLPKKLQADLAINVHFNTLSKVQLFQDCERNLLYDLVLKLRPILYLPGDYICKKGEVGKEMYIVSQGQVEVVGGENNETVLATLHEGSVFGEISLLAMSGRGNRRTADVRSKGYTNVFTLSKHDFEMAMTEYPDAQAVLKKRAKKLLKANARLERKLKQMAVEEIIKTPPETPKLLQTVIQVMDPDSNFVKQLETSIQKNHRSVRKHHSRSHSHRLSTSATNIHQLTPSRSYSFRLSTHCSRFSLNPLLTIDQAPYLEKNGFNTDDENEEPMFDNSSDDVSLSEVLHEALAISSFDDDDENAEDSELVVEISRSHSATHNHCPSQNQNEKSDEREEDKIKNEFVNEEIDVMCNSSEKQVEDDDDGRRNCDRPCPESDVTGAGNPSKGSPGTECEISSNSSKITSTHMSSNTSSTHSNCNTASTHSNNNTASTHSNCNTASTHSNTASTHSNTTSTHTNGNTANTHINNVGTNTHTNNNTANSLTTTTHNNKPTSNHNIENLFIVNERHPGKQPIHNESSTKNEERSTPFSGILQENHVINQKQHDRPENRISFQNVSECASKLLEVSADKSDRLLPPCLVLHDQGTPSIDVGVSTGRVRKLSVVSPPISPVSPQDKHNVPWPSDSKQISSLNENNADFIMGCLTPTEAPSSCLPSIIRPVKVNVISDVSKVPHKATNSPALANGLEGCCGAGMLMEASAEKQVTFAVEVHKQKNAKSSTINFHGHTETML